MVDVVVVEVVDMDDVVEVIRLAAAEIIPRRNIARPQKGEKQIIKASRAAVPAWLTAA
jgi:hypothetical protein